MSNRKDGFMINQFNNHKSIGIRNQWKFITVEHVKKIISKNHSVSGPMEFNTNIKKIIEVTGWEPKFDIKKGLEKTFKIMKSYYLK